MLFDGNIYLGHWPFSAQPGQSPAELVQTMDRCGIGRACLTSINALFYRDCMPGNDEVLAAWRAYPDRFVPIAVINPAYPRWQRDFTELVAAGVRGIAVFPDYHGYPVQLPELNELLRLAGEQNLLVQLPTRLIDIRGKHTLDPAILTTEADFARLINDHPATAFAVLGGFGSAVAAHIDAVKRSAPVFFDFARTDVFGSAPSFNALISAVGAKHVIFASQLPFQYPDINLVKLFYSPLSPADQARVEAGNLNAFFAKAGKPAKAAIKTSAKAKPSAGAKAGKPKSKSSNGKSRERK